MRYTVITNWPPAGATVIHDEQGRVVAEMYSTATPALAHQFAAAPELLEAAEKVLARMKSDCSNMCAFSNELCREIACPVLADIERLEAAIARAKGGEAGE